MGKRTEKFKCIFTWYGLYRMRFLIKLYLHILCLALIRSFSHHLCARVFLPAMRSADIRWNSGSCSHLNMRRNVSRPDFSFDHGFGFRNRSERVPCDRHKTRCANIACGMLYLFSSALILWANSFVFISSTSLLNDVTVCKKEEDKKQNEWVRCGKTFNFLWITFNVRRECFIEKIPCICWSFCFLLAFSFLRHLFVLQFYRFPVSLSDCLLLDNFSSLAFNDMTLEVPFTIVLLRWLLLILCWRYVIWLVCIACDGIYGITINGNLMWLRLIVRLFIEFIGIGVGVAAAAATATTTTSATAAATATASVRSCLFEEFIGSLSTSRRLVCLLLLLLLLLNGCLQTDWRWIKNWTATGTSAWRM